MEKLFYCCGPTTYNNIHLGNIRTIYFSRVLFNLCQVSSQNNYFYCMNFTDIDDKIIDKSKDFNSFYECTNFFLNKCKNDLESFGLYENKNIIYLKATNHISDIIQIIDILIKFDLAYKNESGVYFNLSFLFDKKKLEQLDITEEFYYYKLNPNRKGYESKNDFVLWKFISSEPFWNSPWGKGRPGWHIECSAIFKYLTERLNIQKFLLCGGIDLIFPHHENQLIILDLFFRLKYRKSIYKDLDHIFHINSLLNETKKMSKTLGNILTLKDIEKKSYNALKLSFLSNNFNSTMEFSFNILEQNQKKIDLLEKDFSFLPESSLYTKNRLMEILNICKKNNDTYNISLFFSSLLSLKKTEKKKLDKKTLYKFLKKFFFLDLK